jgi:hypothetical protein
MDVRRADAQLCVAYIHQPASATEPLPTCTHACVRRAMSSYQASGHRGHPNIFLLLLLFASLRTVTQTTHTVTWPLPASQPASQYQRLLAPGAVPITSPPPRGQCRATDTELYKLLQYWTCRFRKSVASTVVYGRFGFGHRKVLYGSR